MRIIAGRLGGRNFKSPSGHRTHPMSDKVRGALFNVLGDINGLSVLDAFAGSGALSFEAVSRGAKQAIAIDNDKNAHQTIQQNSKNLGLTGQVKAIRANLSGWSDNNPELRFGIVLCDPPYDHLQQGLLQKLAKHVADTGLFVLSWPGDAPVPTLAGLKELKKQTYGDAQLMFYRRDV